MMWADRLMNRTAFLLLDLIDLGNILHHLDHGRGSARVRTAHFGPHTLSDRGDRDHDLHGRLLRLRCLVHRPHLGRLPPAADHTVPDVAGCPVDDHLVSVSAASRLRAGHRPAVPADPRKVGQGHPRRQVYLGTRKLDHGLRLHRRGHVQRFFLCEPPHVSRMEVDPVARGEAAAVGAPGARAARCRCRGCEDGDAQAIPNRVRECGSRYDARLLGIVFPR